MLRKASKWVLFNIEDLAYEWRTEVTLKKTHKSFKAWLKAKLKTLTS